MAFLLYFSLLTPGHHFCQVINASSRALNSQEMHGMSVAGMLFRKVFSGEAVFFNLVP